LLQSDSRRVAKLTLVREWTAIRQMSVQARETRVARFFTTPGINKDGSQILERDL